MAKNIIIDVWQNVRLNMLILSLATVSICHVFGFEDFCISCYNATIDVLFKVLIQIDNVRLSKNNFTN